MKKTLAIIMTFAMIFSLSTLALAAVDYDQIFAEGQNGVRDYRIPALYTLNDGSVFAAADMRYSHGQDSPGNIDTLIAQSADGYTGWEYTVLNHFDDYADGVTETASASFIDTAVVQSEKTGRIFVVVDAQPAGCGYLQCKQGSGYIEINGKKYMALTAGSITEDPATFDYYIGDFVNGFAPVLKADDSGLTEYFVDAEFDLYKNGKPLTMTQHGSEDVIVNQNIFYADAELKCFCTTYLWMRYSDDNGASWSEPVILTGQVKYDSEYFLGICPGQGFVTTLTDGTERIIFNVYDNGSIGWNAIENVSTIYSDDNGETWHRGADTYPKMAVGKTSESQIVELNDGVLRMFSRNSGDYIAYADSTDNGITWSDFQFDTNLKACGNCMCSFINTSKTINGQKVILGSFPSTPGARTNGVIKVGLVDSKNNINWVSTYNLTSGGNFFAYSSMTELSDGNFGILYEDKAAHISYLVFSIDENGNISEINGNNPVAEENDESTLSGWQKFIKSIKDFFVKLLKFLGMA